MKNIVIITTGGTIASIGDPQKGNVIAGLSGEEIVNKKYTETKIEIINFINKNSVNLTPEDMLELSKLTEKTLKREDVDGVVITHGTSLMEETAFVLDILHTSKKPVVLTGAQINPGNSYSDGDLNLENAITVASSDLSYDKGVMLVFCSKIFEARYIRKIDTTNLDGFDACIKGQLGSVYFNNVYFNHEVKREVIKDDIKKLCPVSIFPFYAGANPEYLRSAIVQKEKGVVIEGVGLGNVNEDFYNAIEDLIKNNIKVIITTRCINGKIVPVYAYKGGAASLIEKGVKFSSLSSPKARLLLMTILSFEDGFEHINNYLD